MIGPGTRRNKQQKVETKKLLELIRAVARVADRTLGDRWLLQIVSDVRKGNLARVRQ